MAKGSMENTDRERERERRRGRGSWIKPLSTRIFVGKVCWQNKVGKF